jgi:hypothetical protein
MNDLTQQHEALNNTLSNNMSLVSDVILIHKRISRTQQQSLRPHFEGWKTRFKTVTHSLSEVLARASHFRGIQLLLYLKRTLRTEIDPFELNTDDGAPTAQEKTTIKASLLSLMTDSAPYIIYDFDQTAKVFIQSSFN